MRRETGRARRGDRTWKAIRSGDWKFIPGGQKPGSGQLYDLSKDVGEQNNIIAKHPEMAKKLEAKIKILTSGNVSRAAEIAGITRPNMHRKVTDLGLSADDYRPGASRRNHADDKED